MELRRREAVARRFPAAPALRHADRQLSWRDFDERANGVATSMLAAGLGHQDKVAQSMRNRPEYLESMFAVFKAGLVPVNTIYRYGDEDLRYLWSNSDTTAVVFDPEFTDVCERLRLTMPGVRPWLRVGDEYDCPDWATPYGRAATPRPDGVLGEWARSGDDLYLLYTGGKPVA